MKETIVAVVRDHGTDETWKAAVQLAARKEAPLILYDIDAASLLSSPVPIEDGEVYEQPLNVSQLEGLCRFQIAEQVKAARARGVDTWAWLPMSARPHALVTYLEGLEAHTLVLPRVIAHPTWFERFEGLTAQRIQKEAARMELVLVEEEKRREAESDAVV